MPSFSLMMCQRVVAVCCVGECDDEFNAGYDRAAVGRNDGAVITADLQHKGKNAKTTSAITGTHDGRAKCRSVGIG